MSEGPTRSRQIVSSEAAPLTGQLGQVLLATLTSMVGFWA